MKTVWTQSSCLKLDMMLPSLAILIWLNLQASYYIKTMALPPSSGGAITLRFFIEIFPVLQVHPHLLDHQLRGHRVLVAPLLLFMTGESQ